MDLIFELHLIDNNIFKVRGIEKISFNYKNIYFNFLEFFFSRKGIDKISRDFTQMIFVSQEGGTQPRIIFVISNSEFS